MYSNAVLPGLTGRLVWRLGIWSVASCREGVCLQQYDGFSYCQSIILPAV